MIASYHYHFFCSIITVEIGLFLSDSGHFWNQL